MPSARDRYGSYYRDGSRWIWRGPARNDTWYRRNGYTRRGTVWVWRDRPDSWWLSNGYWWNGLAWVLLSTRTITYDYKVYGPFDTFTGIVDRIHNDREIDIRINNNIYNVYTVDYIPYDLRVGDIVYVDGQRYGRNDIRNSSVSIRY